MATVIRYTGNPNGYMDFYMVDERIMCQNTINNLSTQELWDGITSTEDEELASGYLGIADADGKNPAISSALNITLLRNWRVGTEKTSGSFKLTGGNTVSETLGTEPFEPNNLVFMTNQLSQFGTTVISGSGVTSQDKTDIANAVWEEQLSSHINAGTTGENATFLKNKTTSIETKVDALPITIWDESKANLVTSGSIGEFIAKELLTLKTFLAVK